MLLTSKGGRHLFFRRKTILVIICSPYFGLNKVFHLLKVDTDTDQSTLTTGRAHYGQLITILFYETNSFANVVPFAQF